MPRITAEAAQGLVAFEAEKGRKLVLCLEDNGIDILHRCGGNAKCTTCRVEVLAGDPGEIGEPEKAILATICTCALFAKQASKALTPEIVRSSKRDKSKICRRNLYLEIKIGFRRKEKNYG
ncbi:MAG: (2Fe-2S)-binding protein [Acidobacteria bacterium]|nr:(2Fe-2S)-binding protein [Acidobacteriota bacterium]